jgi:hypothetical protein
MKKYDVKVKRMKLTIIELKNPIKMSKMRKRMSPPIPLVMRIDALPTL